MSKLPFMKFYTGDWYSGTKTLNHRVKGYYVDLLCLMWEKSDGTYLADARELANLWSIPNDYFDQNQNPEWDKQVESILNELVNAECISCKKLRGKLIFELFQKRIYEDKKELMLNAKRQALHRSNALSNCPSNGEITEKSRHRSQKLEVIKDKDVSSELDLNTNPPPEPFLTFKTNGPIKTWVLSKARLSQLKELYPGADVELQCRRAQDWCERESSRRKTAKGMDRFLCTWLGREQNRFHQNGSFSEPKKREVVI